MWPYKEFPGKTARIHNADRFMLKALNRPDSNAASKKEGENHTADTNHGSYNGITEEHAKVCFKARHEKQQNGTYCCNGI